MYFGDFIAVTLSFRDDTFLPHKGLFVCVSSGAALNRVHTGVERKILQQVGSTWKSSGKISLCTWTELLQGACRNLKIGLINVFA